MATTKKPAPRRPAGKNGGRTSRKIAKARKPRSDKGTKVAKGGTPKPQHVVLPLVPAEPPHGFDPPMDGVRRPSVTDALPRVSLELDDHDLRAARALKWLGYGLILVVLTVGFVSWARAGVVAVIPTEAGGGVRLTDTACPNDTGAFVAYLVQTGGKMNGACWSYDMAEGGALVNYGNGDIYLYQVGDSMLTEYGRQKLGGGETKL